MSQSIALKQQIFSVAKEFWLFYCLIFIVTFLSIIAHNNYQQKVFATNCAQQPGNFVHVYNECEKGNPTFCNPGGSTTGQMIDVWKDPKGNYCCNGNAGSCSPNCTPTCSTCNKGTQQCTASNCVVTTKSCTPTTLNCTPTCSACNNGVQQCTASNCVVTSKSCSSSGPCQNVSDGQYCWNAQGIVGGAQDHLYTCSGHQVAAGGDQNCGSPGCHINPGTGSTGVPDKCNPPVLNCTPTCNTCNNGIQQCTASNCVVTSKSCTPTLNCTPTCSACNNGVQQCTASNCVVTSKSCTTVHNGTILVYPRKYVINTNIKNLLANKVLGANVIIINGSVTYDATTKTFTNPNFSLNNLPAGQYDIYLHVDGYLDKQLTLNGSTTFTITTGQTTIPVGPVALTPGDIAPQPHGDNVIDIQDYNGIFGCMGLTINSAPTATCPNPKVADINHDGVINQKDLDIIHTEFAQQGDVPTITTPNPTSSTSNPASQPVKTFTCVTDPACSANSKTIQLCPLKCSPSN